MSQPIASIKPLFLSEEEAIALLDLCLMSRAETDSIKERSLLKLTDLIRRYIADETIHDNETILKQPAQAEAAVFPRASPSLRASFAESPAEAVVKAEFAKGPRRRPDDLLALTR